MALSLPLFFEANRGQVDSRVQFLARSGGYNLFVTPTETVFAEARIGSARLSLGGANKWQPSDESPAILRMKLQHANSSPSLSGVNELPGKVNYLIGKDPKGWHVGIPIYTEVHSAAVYPGIDLVFHGDQKLLEYDFRVSPGADPQRIQFQVTGARKMQITENGDLVLHTADTEFRMHKPVMYQEIGHQRRQVDGGFLLKNSNLVAFDVAAYDKKLPLIIDPSIVFASFLGGTGEELPVGEDLDTTTANAPKLYVAGLTSNLATFSESSTTLGTSPGAEDYTFVAKIDPTTTGAASLDYLTFIGGSVIFSGGTGACQNAGNYLKLDMSGGAGAVEPVIAGQTNCKDFPVTSGGPTASTEDLFLTRLTSSGAGLDNSIFFGGNGIEGLANGWTASIAVNSAGSVALVGATTSTNLPTTTGAYSASINNGTPGIFNDCFVAEFNRSFSIQYLTYLNVGTGTTSSSAATCGVRAIDAAGKIYAGGGTYSATAFNAANGGTGANGFQPAFAGTAGTNENSFLAVLDPTQTGLHQLFYSTYLGGGGPTDVQDADVDISSGLVLYSGITFANSTTAAPDIPLANAYQSTNTTTGGSAFVTVIDSTKTGAASLVASTYLGGSAGGGTNEGDAVAFDRQSGNPPALRVVVGGRTTASNFPTVNPLQGSLVGTQNAFLSVFSVPNSGVTYPMTLLFSTYLGGGVTASGQNELIRSVIADPNHNIYALGRSPSANFFGNTSPATTVNGFQTTCASCGEATPAADLVIFEVPPQGGISVPDLTIAKSHVGDFVQGQTGAQYTIAVGNSGAGATTGVVSVVDTLPAGLTATGISGTGWTCTVATLTCTRSDSLAAGTSYPVITLTINVSSSAPASLTNTAVVSGGNETNTSNDTATDVTTITSMAALHFVVAAPPVATAGSPISVSVEAVDPSNNVVTGYTGTVHFTSTDARAVLPANTTLTNGTGVFGVTLTTVGNQTVTATDTVTSSITGTSNTVAVGTGVVTQLEVVATPAATVGTPDSVTVAALDQFDNLVTTYTGTVHFTSSDASAVLPANSTLPNGAKVFQVTFKTTGTQTVTATDTVTSSITGTSNPVTVSPPAVQSITVLPPSTTLSVGSIQQYIAVGTFSDGSTQDLGANVTWSSSNAALATISSSGAATGVKTGGPITIMATSTANTGVSSMAQLTVSGNAPFAYVGDIVSANCCVDVINTSNNQIVKTIPITNINEPLGMTPDQTRVYVADNVDNLIGVIDTTTDTLMTTIPMGVDPTSVAVTPDGKFGYVADFGDTNVNVFNVSTNAVTATIPIAFPAGWDAITPDGTSVYVDSTIDGRVSVINTATNTVSTTFTITAPAGSPAPGCIIGPVFNATGTLGYFIQSACAATSASPGTVNVLSIPSNTVVAIIPVGAFPFQAAITPDGSRLYVANAGSNDVSVIDTATNAVTTTISVAKGPQSIAITPDGTRAYVAEPPAAMVSVIDTSTNTVTSNIATTVPFGIVFATPPPASTATTTLTLTPPNWVFNSQPLGTTSASQVINVQNPGTSAVALNVSLTGPNTGDFVLGNASGSGCPASLGAGSSCNLLVSFAPTAIGQRTALVSITNNNGTASYTQSAPLSGTGISLSSIVLTPPNPSIFQGGEQQFTATGTYNDNSTANLTGQVAWNSASKTVATINAAGLATGVGTGTSNITASLSGVASASDLLSVTPALYVPGASVTPSTLTYPSQVIGVPGTSQPVTVNSTGTGPLAISSITFSGANPTEYTETDNCPIYPAATLPAGTFCTIHVTFAPLAVGTRTANLVVTDNNNNIPGSQQSVSLTGTATAPAPATTTVQLPFTPGTNVSQVAVVNCPSGTSPCTDPNAHSMKILFSQVNTPFVMTVTAYEVPISQANGVCLAGNNETNDFDCRFTEYFTIQTEANGNIIVPECIPYSNGNCVFYRITNAPNIDQYSGPVFENIAWNNTAFVPPSFYQANNPQAYDDPDYAPYNVNHQFALDVTDYFNPVAQVGTDPTITLHTTRFSDFTVAWPGSLPSPAFTFTFLPPLNGTPSVMQGATIPVAFSLTQNGAPITNATTAPNIVSMGIFNAQGVRQPAYTPGGTAAAFVYNPTAQLYQLTLATQNLVPGTYTLLVNSNLFTQQTATFTITGVPLQILTASPLLSGAEGVLYAQPFTAIGGTAPYTWTVTSGSLPSGLTLSTAGFLNGTPTVTGTFTFTVQVTDSAQNSQSTAYSLTVNLPVAGAGVSPSTLTYPTQVIGTTSAAQTVTVNSTGTGPLTISSISFTGANPTEYSEIDNCPISPVYLPAGMSCTIQVSFAPLAVGTRTANLVVTDNNNNIPGSQQSVSLTGTATAPAPTVTTFQLPFTPGTNVSQVAVVNCPSGTSPCTDPNAHSMKILFTQVNTPFVLTVTANEVPVSQANGVCEAGNNEDNDFDCRFTEYFTIQTEANGNIIVPECIPYSNGNCVFYSVTNTPATAAYSGPVFENIAWNNTAFVPPSFYQVNNPQAYDHPGYAPYTVNNQFALDVTDYFNPVAQVGTDPTITLHTTRFSDFTVAWPGSLPSPAYTFTFQPPLNGAPSVMQGGTIPVAFSLTQSGTPITNAITAPNIVSMGLINAQGIRQPAYAPGGTAATFVYNSTAQLYQLTLATQNLVPGTYTLFVNSNLFSQQVATFTITAVPLQILTTSPLPSGTDGVLYPLAFTAIGGTAPYSWAVTSGSLPNGLTLSTAGFLDGTPTATGTSTFTVQVTDSAQNSLSTSYSLTIGPPVLVSIAVTPASPSVTQGSTQQFTATGTYTDGTTKNLTNSVTWTSSATTIASISTTGLATGVSPGASNIMATLGNVISPITTLTVVPPPGVNLSATLVSSTTDASGNYIFTIRIANSGAATASAATVKTATLTTVAGTTRLTTTTTTSLPDSLGNIASLSSVTTTLTFPASAGSANSTGAISLGLGFTGGTASSVLKATLP